MLNACRSVSTLTFTWIMIIKSRPGCVCPRTPGSSRDGGPCSLPQQEGWWGYPQAEEAGLGQAGDFWARPPAGTSVPEVSFQDGAGSFQSAAPTPSAKPNLHPVCICLPPSYPCHRPCPLPPGPPSCPVSPPLPRSPTATWFPACPSIQTVYPPCRLWAGSLSLTWSPHINSVALSTLHTTLPPCRCHRPLREAAGTAGRAARPTHGRCRLWWDTRSHDDLAEHQTRGKQPPPGKDRAWCLPHFLPSPLKWHRPPWPVGLSGLRMVPKSKRSQVRFPVRACAWVVGSVPGGGGVQEAANQCFSPSLCPSLPLSLKLNKVLKKKWHRERRTERAPRPAFRSLMALSVRKAHHFLLSLKVHVHSMCGGRRSQREVSGRSSGSSQQAHDGPWAVCASQSHSRRQGCRASSSCEHIPDAGRVLARLSLWVA